MPAPSGPIAGQDPRNQLLELLPNGERERLRSNMVRIPIEPHDVFMRPGDAMRSVYFPLRGVVSLMTPM